MSRTALITGASAGLGAEFARQLAQAGYSLVLVARRADKLQSLADELQRQHGTTTHILAHDLADPGTPQAIWASLAEQHIDIDYLVNNAGAGGPDLLTDRDWPAHQAYLQLMLTSVTHLCHLFVPPMQARGFGRVINVASVAGRFIRSGDSHYGPIKAYLVALSEGLRHTRADGVHVCALCPGFTHTDFHAEGELREMKAGLPAWVWYSAATVVREGLRAVEKGKVVKVSGRLYRWLDPLLQSPLTRPLLRRFVA